jgi:RNA polymerase sigma factor (sigma-70 family)
MSGDVENFPKAKQALRVEVRSAGSKPKDPIKPGDFAEFIEKAVEEHESALIGYARIFVHDLDRARDVVQDTFILLCQQDPDEVREHIKSWLLTASRSRCLDMLRKDKRIEPIDDLRWQKVAGSEAAPDEQADSDEQVAHVMRFMDRLAKNQREVIFLKFQQGMSYAEIRGVTGLTEGNIGFLIHTGLKRLREWLSQKQAI